MTEPPKKKQKPETATAPSLGKVVNVDFGKPPEVAIEVYVMEAHNRIGLQFSEAVQEFQMDTTGAHNLAKALAEALQLVEG